MICYTLMYKEKNREMDWRFYDMYDETTEEDILSFLDICKELEPSRIFKIVRLDIQDYVKEKFIPSTNRIIMV